MPFNIGPGELLLLAVVALLLFGPKRLPEIGRSVGEGLASFKKAMNSMADPASPPSQAALPAGPPHRIPADPSPDGAVPQGGAAQSVSVEPSAAAKTSIEA